MCFFHLSYQFEPRIAKIIFNSIGKASSCFSELNYSNQFNRELLGPKWQRVSAKERGKKRERDSANERKGKERKKESVGKRANEKSEGKERIYTIMKERECVMKSKRDQKRQSKEKER